jgi:hypothetical protein
VRALVVERVWDGTAPPWSPRYQRFQQTLSARGVLWERLVAGGIIEFGPRGRLRALASEPPVLMLEVGPRRALLLGRANPTTQQWLLAAHPEVRRAELVWATGRLDPALAAIAPQSGFIFSGRAGRTAMAGNPLWSTAQSGGLTVRCHGGGWTVEPSREDGKPVAFGAPTAPDRPLLSLALR